MMKTLTLGAGIALAGILLPASLYAGTESKAVVETATKSAITGDLGVNFVSEYISRGAPQEIKGVIAQPYADLYFSLYEGEGFVNKVSLNLGVWSSLHSAHTLAGSVNGSGLSTTSAWYEFDYTPGVAVTFAKNYTLTASYLEFDSPNDAFLASRNVNFSLAYGVLNGEYSLDEEGHLTASSEMVAFRGLFLIDLQGIVRHQLVNDLPLGRSVDETLRIVDALQYFEQHGEVCPANWMTGKAAMKPTFDGVAVYLAAN